MKRLVTGKFILINSELRLTEFFRSTFQETEGNLFIPAARGAMIWF